MKITMISGSPKTTGSTSMHILTNVEQMLQNSECESTVVSADTIMNIADKTERTEKIRNLFTCDAVVLSFPLYFDGIPSNLLKFMQEAAYCVNANPAQSDETASIYNDCAHTNHGQGDETASIYNDCMHANKAQRLYVIVNNGFYDASQNELAIEMANIWGKKCGFMRGTAVAVGAGGMIQMIPMGKGPMHNLGIVLQNLADEITGKSVPDANVKTAGGCSNTVKAAGSCSDNVKEAGGCSDTVKTAGGCSDTVKAAGGCSDNVKEAGGCSDNVKKTGAAARVVFVEPNFPRFLYLHSAHIGWNSMAKQNGLRKRDICGIIKDSVR